MHVNGNMNMPVNMQPVNVNMQPVNVNVPVNPGDSDATMAGLTVPEPAGQMAARLYASPPRQRQANLPTGRTKKRQRGPGAGTDSNLKHLPKNQLWQARFDELCRYKQEFGSCQVPVCSKTHPHLGRWVDNQRQAYRMYMENKRSWLNTERIAALDSIGFIWVAQAIPALSFAERLQQLKEFREQNGHCRVPNRHPSGLGKWIADQRRRKDVMTQERWAQLDDAGMEWEKEKKYTWEDRMEKLRSFREEHGHTNVPPNHTDQDLARWVRNVRHMYTLRKKGKSSRLTDARVGGLVVLGFDFEGYEGRSKTWDENYQELCAFEKEYGHCRPSKTAEAAKYERLTRWILMQQWQHNRLKEGKESKLTKERIDKLEAIGFFKKITKKNGKVLVDGQEVADDEEEEENVSNKKSKGKRKNKKALAKKRGATLSSISAKRRRTTPKSSVVAEVEEAPATRKDDSETV